MHRGRLDCWEALACSCCLFSAAVPCADAGNEDIVLSTFRQQQKAYRDLLEGMKARLSLLCPIDKRMHLRDGSTMPEITLCCPPAADVLSCAEHPSASQWGRVSHQEVRRRCRSPEEEGEQVILPSEYASRLRMARRVLVTLRKFADSSPS